MFRAESFIIYIGTQLRLAAPRRAGLVSSLVLTADVLSWSGRLALEQILSLKNSECKCHGGVRLFVTRTPISSAPLFHKD